jgi:AsmA protein
MDHTTHPTNPPHQPARRRGRWLAAAFVALVVVCLIVLPPLVNLNRFEHRIAAGMSESLGRTVTIDPPLKFHLLPVPMLELNGLVVYEDPNFGSEPTIRAQTVEARLRLSSLWRRHIEFSRIKFINPSLNLVRNPEGRWNLDNILVHASRIDAAPTAQRHPGSAPRFPYIEATGARVNIKLGDEKMPFSLTDAEFALWLPSPQQWQVRLEGKPTRTDGDVADAGTMRLEGSLEHASKLEDVPVHLVASWHDAPLGEATTLLTGSDAGWRGTLHADATLDGPLGRAQLFTRVTFDQLRRADFVPANPLDVSLSCITTANTALAQLTSGLCQLHDPSAGAGPLALTFPALSLQSPADAAFSLRLQHMPLRYAFSWLRLLSPRIPPNAAPDGILAVQLDRDSQHTWSGHTELMLPREETQSLAPNKADIHLTWNVQAGAIDGGCRQALRLQPATIALPDGGPLVLDSTISACGYTLHASGTATEAELDTAAKDLPHLMDGVAPLLPAGQIHARFDITCTRSWGAEPVCTGARAVLPPKPARKSRR